MGENKEEYNNIPVYYCKHCLSLKIKGIAELEGLDYCDDCGATEIATTSIQEWEELYKNRYGFKYLENY